MGDGVLEKSAVKRTMSSSILASRNSVISILPDDIIAKEILPRLPVKSLLRFRSVCKTWNMLISDPMFINLHFNRSVERKAMHITLVFNTSPVTIYSLDPENPSRIVPDDINGYPPPFSSFNYEIGSCDGLVCTRFNNGLETVSVWNASTRTHMTFPYHGHSRQSSYGFIFDSASRDYKFVSVRYIDSSRSSEVTVYSTGDPKGKFIRNIPYQTISKKAGVVANGAVHWLAFNCMPDQSFSKQVILAFNPTCQKFEEIPIPANKKDGLDDMNLAQLGGSLSIVFTYSKRFEVWLMKEYGVKDYWSMYFVVPADDVYFLDRPLRVVPLYITKKGDLILQINYKKLFMYEQKQKRLKSIRIKYPETGLPLTGNVSNRPFYAITLLDSFVDTRNSRGGRQKFIGRKNKSESWLQGPIRTLTPCSENSWTENIGSDFANDSTDKGSYYDKKIAQRFLEIVINTSDRKLYKLLKECKMDLEAATIKFAHQALALALRENVPYMKREFGVCPQQISGDATAKNLTTKNVGLDSTSTRQIQFENDSNASYGYRSAEGRASDSHPSVSSATQRVNHGVGVHPIPELGASMPHATQQRSQEDNKVYQHNQNQQLPRRPNGPFTRVARLAILLASSKFDPDMKRELEASSQQISRDATAKNLRTKNTGSDSASIRQIRVGNDSSASYGSAEGKAVNSQSAVTGNDVSVSFVPERVNNEVCGIPHNQNQKLPGWAEGRHTTPSLSQSGEQMGIFQDPRFQNVIIDALANIQLPPTLSMQYGSQGDPNHNNSQVELFQDPRFHALLRKALANRPSAQQSSLGDPPAAQ